MPQGPGFNYVLEGVGPSGKPHRCQQWQLQTGGEERTTVLEAAVLPEGGYRVAAPNDPLRVATLQPCVSTEDQHISCTLDYNGVTYRWVVLLYLAGVFLSVTRCLTAVQCWHVSPCLSCTVHLS